MYDIRLVNMPFANLHIPSLGLTQLTSATRAQLGDRVQLRVHYLNHDFAQFFTLKTYREIIALGEHQNSGIGDWLFRQEAFPDQPDNHEEFFARYYPGTGAEQAEFRAFVLERRQVLPDFLDELVERYGLAQADLVGMTSMFAQNVACFALARRIKLHRPQTTVVVGGANCETPMGQEIARGVPQIDFVFSGPALRSFPELVGHLLAGDTTRVHQVHGVFSRRNVDRVVAGRADAAAAGGTELLPAPGAILPIGLELDLDTELELDFDSFLDDVERTFPAGEVEPALPFETSRGCWWGERAHCTFCGLNSLTMNFRLMGPPNALRLLRSLFARYDHRCKQYICVDNIMPREYVAEVFAHLEPPPGTTIFYEVKADLEDADLAVLARAGVTIVQPGIESFATSTLKLMKKGVSAFRNLRFLQGCLRHDIFPTWNLLVGFPRERPEVYEKYAADLPLMVHLPPPTGVYPVRFDRYSPYFNQADEYGLQLEPVDFYRLTYPLSPGALQNLAYYFVDRNYDAQYFQEMVGWLNELRRLVLRWQRLWHGRATSSHPQLHLCTEQGSPAVYDSRSGRATRTRITEPDRQLLIELLDAKPVNRLLAGEHVVAGQLDRLRRHGWLFEEGDRVMSLVLPEPPPERAHVTSPVADFNFDVDINDVPLLVEPVAGEGAVDAAGAPELVAVAREQRRVSRSMLSRAGEQHHD